LALAILTLILAYAVFQYGGVLRTDWNVCLLSLGLLALFYWLSKRRGDLTPPLPRFLRWLFLLLPGYAAFQLLPLPERVLGLLSPNRAALLAGMHMILPGTMFAPLSAVPVATLMHFFRIIAFTVVCLLIREMAWCWHRRPWLPVLPIIIIAALESGIGLAQSLMAGHSGFAQGTYINKNHFAGFLEMALPFAAMASVSAWRGLDSHRRLTLGRGSVAVLATSVAALILWRSYTLCLVRVSSPLCAPCSSWEHGWQPRVCRPGPNGLR